MNIWGVTVHMDISNMSSQHNFCLPSLRQTFWIMVTIIRHHLSFLYVFLMLTSDFLHALFFLECILVVTYAWDNFQSQTTSAYPYSICRTHMLLMFSLPLIYESWISDILDCKKFPVHQHSGCILIKICFLKADWFKAFDRRI